MKMEKFTIESLIPKEALTICVVGEQKKVLQLSSLELLHRFVHELTSLTSWHS